MESPAGPRSLLDVGCLLPRHLVDLLKAEGGFQMPAPLGLVKIPYQWPSFSAGVTFASASLSLPDLDNLQRQVAMAIRIQPNQTWLLYLIKCSLKRKSHCVRKEEHHSQGAIVFSCPVLPLCPTLGPVCPLPELTGCPSCFGSS